MEIEETRKDGVLVLSLHGHLDTASSTPFEDRILQHINSGEKRIILECSQMEYVNSSGLKVVLIAAKQLDAQGGKLVVCGLSPNVHMIFEMIGFTRILKIVPGETEAWQAIQGDGAAA